MLPALLLSTAIFAASCLASSFSVWSPIRTDEAAWQSSCGHSARVGSVCLSARNGERFLYGVQSTAQQNVAFSAGGHYFTAYCPILDKGEEPYAIHYGLTNDAAFYRILGRHSSERCCSTQYIDIDRNPSEIRCIEPAVGSNAMFPPTRLAVKS